MKYKAVSVGVAVLVLATGLLGCSSISYYSQIMNGHHALMEAEENIHVILVEHKYDKKTRAKLSRALEIRQFASDKLGLPENDSYKTFVKLDRPYPIWNVVATGRFSVRPRQWCFLIIGCISYRGYFKQQDAIAKANELKAEGDDVTVSPAAAYSTLGWFDDPLLSSMLYNSNIRLAGIIFHELAHQEVYIDNDSSFNEAFATAVELEGVRRWLTAQGDTQGIKRYRQYKQHQREFNDLLQATRKRLQALYQSNKPEPVMFAGKSKIIVGMKDEYQDLKKSWGGYSGYDKWMQRDINNADLALVATYHRLVPAFEELLKQQNNDLPRFYKKAEQLGELGVAERKQALSRLTKRFLAARKNMAQP